MKTDMDCATCGARLLDVSRIKGCDSGQCVMVRRLQTLYPYSRRYAQVADALEALGVYVWRPGDVLEMRAMTGVAMPHILAERAISDGDEQVAENRPLTRGLA